MFTTQAARILTKRRLRYAWIIAGALWLAWLFSITMGPGRMDLFGQVVGTDYLQFYTAGRTVQLGQEHRLYDLPYQSKLQQEIIGPQLRDYHAFITPAFLALLFQPLARVPYLLSYAVWSLLGLASLWASIWLLGLEAPTRPFIWAMSFFPVFASVSYGQNSLLSLLLLCVVFWLWSRQKPWAAGLVCSLILYKPQLATGIALLWLMDGPRGLRSLAGLAIGAGALIALSVWQLPGASLAYVDFSREVLLDLPSWLHFPLWNLHSTRGFWRLLLPGQPNLADMLSVAMSGALLVGFVLFWRRHRSNQSLMFAGAIGLTLGITPHAMIYDWALLLIPAFLLWVQLTGLRQNLVVLYARVWLIALVSGPLVHAQLQYLPFAMQLSVPALLWTLLSTYRQLVGQESHERLTPVQDGALESS